MAILIDETAREADLSTALDPIFDFDGPAEDSHLKIVLNAVDLVREQNMQAWRRLSLRIG